MEHRFKNKLEADLIRKEILYIVYWGY